jgi:hypothetical protein
MAQRKSTVQVWECDHRSCGVRHYIEKSDTEPLIGITGTVQEVNGVGGSSRESWYSCKPEHVLGAIEGALSRAWEFEVELPEQEPVQRDETVRHVERGDAHTFAIVDNS